MMLWRASPCHLDHFHYPWHYGVQDRRDRYLHSPPLVYKPPGQMGGKTHAVIMWVGIGKCLKGLPQGYCENQVSS